MFSSGYSLSVPSGIFGHAKMSNGGVPIQDALRQAGLMDGAGMPLGPEFRKLLRYFSARGDAT